MDQPAGEREGEGGRSNPDLVEALRRLWSQMMALEADGKPGSDCRGGDRAPAVDARGYGLIPGLPYDAVIARFGAAESVDEAARCVPRLINLLVEHELSVDEATVVVDRLAEAGWLGARRGLVLAVLEAWWIQALRREPAENHADYPPSVVLGLVSGMGSRMTRWLSVWIDELDGPGAHHLADTILGGLHGPGWHGRDDQAQQVLGWARTEAVVNGLALVGAQHLGPDRAGRLLDRLLGLDEPLPGPLDPAGFDVELWFRSRGAGL